MFSDILNFTGSRGLDGWKVALLQISVVLVCCVVFYVLSKIFSTHKGNRRILFCPLRVFSAITYFRLLCTKLYGGFPQSSYWRDSRFLHIKVLALGHDNDDYCTSAFYMVVGFVFQHSKSCREPESLETLDSFHSRYDMLSSNSTRIDFPTHRALTLQQN